MIFCHKKMEIVLLLFPFFMFKCKYIYCNSCFCLSACLLTAALAFSFTVLASLRWYEKISLFLVERIARESSCKYTNSNVSLFFFFVVNNVVVFNSALYQNKLSIVGMPLGIVRYFWIFYRTFFVITTINSSDSLSLALA